MVIREMAPSECLEALAHVSVGRLACARDGQPYIVPIYLTFDGKNIYGFSTLGQKIEWMRSSPLVCVEIDDIKNQNQWTSIIVFGRYEELSDTVEYEAIRAHAYELLQKRVMWWQPAYVAIAHREEPKSLTPIFYRIHIDRITGHAASANGPEPATSPSNERTWFGRILRRLGPRH